MQKKILLFTSGLRGLEDSPGIFTCEGLISQILQSQPESLLDDLLNEYDFLFIPYMNPSSSHLGVTKIDSSISDFDVRYWLDTPDQPNQLQRDIYNYLAKRKVNLVGKQSTAE